MSEAFQSLYSKMVEAKSAGHNQIADDFRVQIENLRQQTAKRPTENEIQQILVHLPSFVLRTFGKSQSELNLDERSNCINAAFNFHDPNPRFETYSTLEFLNRAQLEFIQLRHSEELRRGDLVAMWSRSGGAWDNRLIDVHEMNINDPTFPYGLVFDHVAVALGDGFAFHKPDPTSESRYQIDFLESVLVTTKHNPGFELTCHRKIQVQGLV